MAKSGIEFFDGAMSVDAGSSNATPEQPGARSGGPIATFEGGFEGSSFAVPDRPSNAVDGMSAGKGSPITGPMDC